MPTPAIVPLLAVSLSCVLAAMVVVRLAAPKFPLYRLFRSALIAGLLCALCSGALRSVRHAGTGTQTAWGWPRIVYTRWVSWESPERREGVRWQGLAENAVFYGAVAVLIGSFVVAAGGWPARRATGATGRDHETAT